VMAVGGLEHATREPQQLRVLPIAARVRVGDQDRRAASNRNGRRTAA
jgi:hypothetical protein